jgi:hypothetical protein
MNLQHSKLSLTAIAVSAALAACGGGGGGDTPAATTPTPTTNVPVNTTNPTQAGQQPIVSTPSTPTTPGVTPRTPPSVPDANAVQPFLSTPTYVVGGGQFRGFNLTNLFRRQGQDSVSTTGAVEGVGAVNQSAALDTIATQVHDALVASTTVPDAQALATAAGFARSYTATFNPGTFVDENNSILPLIPGDICVKGMFASVASIEELMFGYREIGLSIPSVSDATGVERCVLTLGLQSLTTAQLPATGAVSVYPYPGKLETLRAMQGSLTEPGVTAASAGHPIFASVASVDALPVAGLTAGGTAIPASEIVLREFTLRKGATLGAGEVVAARVLAASGVNVSAVSNAQASTNVKFPTSFFLIPTAKLDANADYNVTFRSTVRGFDTCVTSAQDNRLSCQSQSWTFKTGAL